MRVSVPDEYDNGPPDENSDGLVRLRDLVARVRRGRREFRLDARVARVGRVVAGRGLVHALRGLERPQGEGEDDGHGHVQDERRQADVADLPMPGISFELPPKCFWVGEATP